MIRRRSRRMRPRRRPRRRKWSRRSPSGASTSASRAWRPTPTPRGSRSTATCPRASSSRSHGSRETGRFRYDVDRRERPAERRALPGPPRSRLHRPRGAVHQDPAPLRQRRPHAAAAHGAGRPVHQPDPAPGFPERHRAAVRDQSLQRELHVPEQPRQPFPGRGRPHRHRPPARTGAGGGAPHAQQAVRPPPAVLPGAPAGHPRRRDLIRVRQRGGEPGADRLPHARFRGHRGVDAKVPPAPGLVPLQRLRQRDPVPGVRQPVPGHRLDRSHRVPIAGLRLDRRTVVRARIAARRTTRPSPARWASSTSSPSGRA